MLMILTAMKLVMRPIMIIKVLLLLLENEFFLESDWLRGVEF